MKPEKIRKPRVITPEQALVRLETLCARAEHCSGELRQKLYTWKISPEKSEEIISGLIERRFVDDRRFARAFAIDKARFARWGERKIALALMSKRLPSDIIKDTLAQIDRQLYETNLCELLHAKARSLDAPRTFEGRTKLFRYGVSKGYPPSLVSELIRKFFA